MRDPEEALLLSSGCLATDQRAKPNHADTKKALAIIAKCLFCLACLVGRGNLNCCCIYMININNGVFVLLLEYRLEYGLAENRSAQIFSKSQMCQRHDEKSRGVNFSPLFFTLQLLCAT